MADSDSDSDYESDLQTFRPLQQVLKPLTAQELSESPDAWPCYFLENAQVFDKHGTLANLLEVGHRGPYVVKGRLSFENDDTEVSRLINNRDTNGISITVNNVTQYSYGLRTDHDSGHICLWAGEVKYGWFELAPAPNYETIYAKTMQAIGTIYFFQALYKRKGAKDMKIEDLLLKYAAREGSGASRHEMEKILKSNAEFLLRHMIAKEESDLTKTEFFAWLASECKDVVADLAKRHHPITWILNSPKTKSVRIAGTPPLLGRNVVVEPYEPGEDDENQDGMDLDDSSDDQDSQSLDDDDLSAEQTLKFPLTTEALAHLQDIPSRIYYLMEHHRHGEAKGKIGPMQNITLKSVATMLYTDFSISDYSIAIWLVVYNASELLPLLAPVWHSSPLYEHLQNPAEFIPSIATDDKTAKHKAAARNMTSYTQLNPRRRLVIPRRTGGSGAGACKGGSSKPSKASSTRTTQTRTAHGSSSRQDTPQAAALSTHRTAGPEPKRRKSTTPNAQTAPPTGKAAIALRAAEQRARLTSGEGVTRPKPAGKVPALSVLFSSQSGKQETRRPPFKRDSSAMDLDSPTPSPTLTPSSLETLDPVLLTLTPQPLSESPTAAVAAEVITAESMRLGHNVSNLLERVSKSGREQVANGDKVAGKPVPKKIWGDLRGY